MLQPRRRSWKLPAPGAGGGRGRLRLLRGDRLHARPAAPRTAAGRRPVLHGAPSGDEAGRPGELPARATSMPRRFRAEPMVRAIELLLQECMSPDAPMVEAHGDEAALRPAVRETPAPDEPAADDAAHGLPAHPPALERPVPRHGHQRRRRPQHLARPRRDPLARGPHPRRLGPVLLRPRPAYRGAVWSAGVSAGLPRRPTSTR